MRPDVVASIPNLGRRSAESFFPPRDIDWPLIRKDPGLLWAAVQFAAMSKVYVESTPQMHSFAEKARARALQILRQRLDVERRHASDALLHILVGIIATDTHIRQARHHTRDSQDNVHLHIKGLRAAMRTRHGWDLDAYHPTLQFEFVW
jgi:hypothetical protein